jgi:hypothetical protein
MWVSDDRFSQIAGMRVDQDVPIESAAPGGDSGSSTPAQRAAAPSADPAFNVARREGTTNGLLIRYSEAART